jgi:hypothetical protein
MTDTARVTTLRRYRVRSTLGEDLRTAGPAHARFKGDRAVAVTERSTLGGRWNQRSMSHGTHLPQRAFEAVHACPAHWSATSPAPTSSGSSGVNALATSFTSAWISAERLTLASENKACVTVRVGPQVKQERQGGKSHSGQRLDESDQGSSGEQRQRG